MKHRIIIIFFLLLCSNAFCLALDQMPHRGSIASSADTQKNTNAPPPSEEAKKNAIAAVSDKSMDSFDKLDDYFGKKMLHSYEFYLCLVVVCFGVTLILIYTVLFLAGRINSDQIVKMSIITVIIFATLFLITCGYDNNQIAPATGLFGTIAGYLLGKLSKAEA